MSNSDFTSRSKKTDSSVTYDSEGNIIDFGSCESEEVKRKYNLTWIPEQILNWPEEANSFNKAIRFYL